MRLHRGVMATVAILEAGTYAYMAWRYETPVSVVAWALILSRALAAPLLSVYLAMARPLPVTARDILAQVELASGLGLIRDAVTIANDASASLSQKVALFGASAVMTPQDRERLDGLLAAVEAQRSPHEAVVIASWSRPQIPWWRWPRAVALSPSTAITTAARTARTTPTARGRPREWGRARGVREDLDGGRLCHPRYATLPRWESSCSSTIVQHQPSAECDEDDADHPQQRQPGKRFSQEVDLILHQREDQQSHAERGNQQPNGSHSQLNSTAPQPHITTAQHNRLSHSERPQSNPV